MHFCPGLLSWISPQTLPYYNDTPAVHQFQVSTLTMAKDDLQSSYLILSYFHILHLNYGHQLWITDFQEEIKEE